MGTLYGQYIVCFRILSLHWLTKSSLEEIHLPKSSKYSTPSDNYCRKKLHNIPLPRAASISRKRKRSISTSSSSSSSSTDTGSSETSSTTSDSSEESHSDTPSESDSGPIPPVRTHIGSQTRHGPKPLCASSVFMYAPLLYIPLLSAQVLKSGRSSECSPRVR